VVDDTVGALLHYAVILSNLNNLSGSQPKLKIIEKLIEEGHAEIDIVNKLGQTPLHMCQNLAVGRLLLDKGAKMDLCEVTGKMPLFTYICSNNFDMCIEILKNGCGLDNKDRQGNSLLFALINSNAPIKLIALLLEAGISVAKEEWIRKRQYPNKRLFQKYPKLLNLIEYKLKNPPTLKELARKALRLHLNRINRSKSILGSVSKLDRHLPSALQDYILLNLNTLETILIK
jgi:ankyrin repeat protein